MRSPESVNPVSDASTDVPSPRPRGGSFSRRTTRTPSAAGCGRQEAATDVSAAATDTSVTSGVNTAGGALAGGDHVSPPRAANTL